MTFRRSTQDIDLGFGLYEHEKYGDKPKVQLIVPHTTPKEKQVKVCVKCNGQVAWIKESRRFICYSCGVSYHEDFTSLPASNDASIKPLQSVDPYEKIEPAFIRINADKRLQGERTNKHITVSGSMRRARVHVNGSPLLATEDVIKRELEGDQDI